ncbi:cytochrome o ubiquinol oxidase subunit IV [Legionella cardiaca]|uniref:Cytochrome bo(3) ubiquinol oxidase subunit 4 n=1 Tax=Legionella cardiaca TaxID=1071983 RepID=A0ABY8APD6_9GAMM|nr:cytochrome o ubiquinol oxidase subunit IV [Legionella cardiaca]WED42388.1 cytochrome o ubiquinol oxidase subunit IV [Legionella cardiaca]
MSKHELVFDVDTGASYGTYQSYTIGFVSSLLLTLFSFYLVASSALPPKILYIAVGALAIMQLFVQLVFFLHLNTTSKTNWNLLSFLFTLVVVLVLVIGTMWIMYNLYANMDMNIMAM